MITLFSIDINEDPLNVTLPKIPSIPPPTILIEAVPDKSILPEIIHVV
jgi:hypothetical protein